MIASACGATSAENPAEAFRAALERTLGAESFHLQEVTTYEGIPPITSEVEYVAPDRFRSTNANGVEWTTIGMISYYADPDEVGRFILMPGVCVANLESEISHIPAIRAASEVRVEGDWYVFEGPEHLEGRARIQDGYVVALTVRTPLLMLDEQVEHRYVFSRIDESLSIEAPPSSRVTRATGPVDLGGVTVTPASASPGSPIPCPPALL